MLYSRTATSLYIIIRKKSNIESNPLFHPRSIIRFMPLFTSSIYLTCTLNTMDRGFTSREAFLILLAPKILALFRYASRKSACLI